MDVQSLINSPVMWIACSVPVALVVIQALLFGKHAYDSGPDVGLSEEQMKRAIKSAAATSIGPTIVVLSGMLSLLVTVGGPVGWMRLSMIGSVMFESIAAGIGTSSVGVTLGTDPMTLEAYTMAIWTMILCSIGWVMFSTFAANKMDIVQSKLSGNNEKKLTTIASAAIIGVFTAMCATHLAKPIYLNIQSAGAETLAPANKNAMAVIIGMIIMAVLNTLAEKKDIRWLKEWAITITILGTVVITSLI